MVTVTFGDYSLSPILLTLRLTHAEKENPYSLWGVPQYTRKSLWTDHTLPVRVTHTLLPRLLTVINPALRLRMRKTQPRSLNTAPTLLAVALPCPGLGDRHSDSTAIACRTA